MVNPSERELYLFNKCVGWYTIKENGEEVLKDNAPAEIKKADKEWKDLHKKNNPFGFEC